MPGQAILGSSHGLGWRTLFASRQIEQPYTGYFHARSDHLIVMHLSGPVQVERDFSGDRTCAKVQRGGLFIVPAGRDFGVSLEGTLETIHIYVAGPVIDAAAREMGLDPTEIAMVPGLGVHDAVIEQMGLVCCTMLKERQTEEQLDMQTLHRIRDQLVGDRTSLMNQIRSLLLERGYIVPQGRAKLAVRLGEMLDGDEPVLGFRIHRLVSDMRLRWIALDERISDLDAEFTSAARTDERTRRLLTIPGIGALKATALVAAVGNARTFGGGRDLAAWLGLVPRQATTGGKPRLLGITKRGSRCLRKNLIQGARSALPTMSKSDTRLGAWLRGLLSRSHPNTVVVALAAKMARIVWALLRHERAYDSVAQAA